MNALTEKALEDIRLYLSSVLESWGLGYPNCRNIAVVCTPQEGDMVRFAFYPPIDRRTVETIQLPMNMKGLSLLGCKIVEEKAICDGVSQPEDRVLAILAQVDWAHVPHSR